MASLRLLSDFPEMGKPLGGHAKKRKWVLSGNVVLYEIVLTREPFIVIRGILPRKTKSE
jgi:hypothetical protein